LNSTGSAYVIGRTSSSDFPVFNAYDPSFNGGSDDVFIAKISPSGNILVYSTFLGGLSAETGGGIAVDKSGFAYVTGVTDSPDFPVVDAFDPYWNGSSDIFVAKLTPDGGTLVYSTFLGGASVEMGGDICVDGACSAYVTGTTYSSSFPVVNACDPTWNGFADAFVAKFASDGKSLVYSTFVGGSDSDICYSLSVDSYGSAYITGMTSSLNFPVVNAYDPAKNGQADAFVTKLTPDGKALAYSTYLGGTSTDNGSSIAVDSAGSACVTGYTYSLDFPVRYPVSPVLKGFVDSFVTKFTPTGQSLAFSTYLGGSGGDYGWAIAVNQTYDAYVTGNTDSLDFPISNAYDFTPNGNTDIFVTKLCVVPPYPPNNFNLQNLQNNYIFFKEYIHRLTWAANLEDPSKIVKYRLYRKVKDAPDTSYQRIAEVSATTFGYDDRGLKKTTLYSYRISAVDDAGNESGYAEVGNN
jgi:hypothetical protein